MSGAAVSRCSKAIVLIAALAPVVFWGPLFPAMAQEPTNGGNLEAVTPPLPHLACIPMGLYLSLEDSGTLAACLAALPRQDVHHVDVTDSERVLGLGMWGPLHS